MKTFLLALLSLQIVAANPLFGQEAESVDSLLCDVACISVHVDSLPSGLADKGITQSVLNDTLIAYLLDAGIEVVDADSIETVPGVPALVLHVDALLEAGIDQVFYSIRLEFTQTVRLVRDENTVAGRVPTWGEGSIGLYTRRWQDELLTDVLRHAQAFSDAFLAANPPLEER
jgi:hypothetical protein